MKYLAILFSVLLLSACSSTPNYSGEFCHNLSDSRSGYVNYPGCIDSGVGTSGNDSGNH